MPFPANEELVCVSICDVITLLDIVEKMMNYLDHLENCVVSDSNTKDGSDGFIILISCLNVDLKLLIGLERLLIWRHFDLDLTRHVAEDQSFGNRRALLEQGGSEYTLYEGY